MNPNDFLTFDMIWQIRSAIEHPEIELEPDEVREFFESRVWWVIRQAAARTINDALRLLQDPRTPWNVISHSQGVLMALMWLASRQQEMGAVLARSTQTNNGVAGVQNPVVQRAQEQQQGSFYR